MKWITVKSKKDYPDEKWRGIMKYSINGADKKLFVQPDASRNDIHSCFEVGKFHTIIWLDESPAPAEEKSAEELESELDHERKLSYSYYKSLKELESETAALRRENEGSKAELEKHQKSTIENCDLRKQIEVLRDQSTFYKSEFERVAAENMRLQENVKSLKQMFDISEANLASKTQLIQSLTTELAILNGKISQYEEPKMY